MNNDNNSSDANYCTINFAPKNRDLYMLIFNRIDITFNRDTGGFDQFLEANINFVKVNRTNWVANFSLLHQASIELVGKYIRVLCRRIFGIYILTCLSQFREGW